LALSGIRFSLVPLSATRYKFGVPRWRTIIDSVLLFLVPSPDCKLPLWKSIFHWVFFLPGGFIASTVVYQGARFFGNAFGAFTGLDAVGYTLFMISVGSYLAGYVFLHVSSLLAPFYQSRVAMILCFSLIFLSGGGCLMNLMERDWVNAIGAVFLGLGSLRCFLKYWHSPHPSTLSLS
jgi:hypothetical protein